MIKPIHIKKDIKNNYSKIDTLLYTYFTVEMMHHNVALSWDKVLIQIIADVRSIANYKYHGHLTLQINELFSVVKFTPSQCGKTPVPQCFYFFKFYY